MLIFATTNKSNKNRMNLEQPLILTSFPWGTSRQQLR
jgi:pyridoxine/pyridoxamine 5'-phosphate oxidase